MAIIQDYHTRDCERSDWKGVDNSLAGAILARFGWQLTPATRDKYWPHHFGRGEKAQFHLTVTSNVDPDGREDYAPATEVFTMIDGYVLGKAERDAGGTYRFWRIEFVNQDEKYHPFREAVLELLGSAATAQSGPALKDKVLSYLKGLTEECAKLLYYFPPHLRDNGSGESAFDRIRQTVRVIEDRKAFDRWLAEERERLRRKGIDPDRLEYSPRNTILEEIGESRRHGASMQTIPWDEKTSARFSQVTILGDPGFGKSWLLCYEARQLAHKAIDRLKSGANVHDIDLPVLMRLPDLASADGTLEDAVVTLTERNYPGGLCVYLRRQIASGRAILLLDAWDEVSDLDARRKLKNQIQDFAHDHRKRILLTSRLVGYELTPPPLPEGKELELLPWDWPHIQSFVRTWFGAEAQKAKRFLDRLKKHPQFRGLARIPLMLMLLCRACPEGDFPERRSDVYRKCLWGLLRDWRLYDKENAARYTKIQLSDTYITRLIEVLEHLSLKLLEKGLKQFSEADIPLVVEPFLNTLYQNRPSHEFTKEKAMCADLIQRLKDDGILISTTSGERELRFLHLTFQEYLAARALAKREDCIKTALKHIYDPAWDQVLVMLAGVLEEPGPYIAALLRENRKDLLCRPFLLALQASAQTNRDQLPKRFFNDIADEVRSIWLCEETYFPRDTARLAIQHFPEAQGRLLAMWGAPSAIHTFPDIDAELIVPALLEALRDQRADVRLIAAADLGGKLVLSRQFLPWLKCCETTKTSSFAGRRLKLWGRLALSEPFLP